MELFGRRFDTGRPVRLEVREERIASCTPIEAEGAPRLEGTDWPWLAPGLIDIQVNGYGGQEFSALTLTVEKAAAILRAFEPFGVTRLCPTVTTESFNVLRHALATLHRLCEECPDLARRVPGLHLEGPYITAQDGARGAHPKPHCRPPDWDKFQRLQDAAGGRIRILTMSPEYEGSSSFVRQVAASGVIVAIGHTAATPEQVRAAVDAGARLSTHLGNGSHPTLHRLRNYLWAQMAEDRLVASLICDGHHLPPEVVKSLVRTKTPERCILISDISGQAGQPPGRYSSPFCDVEILPDGGLVIAGQRELLGGASLPLHVGLANVMHFAGVELAAAVRMAVHHPAQLLEIEPGGLEPGDRADLVQFSLTPCADRDSPPKVEVLTTVIQGEVVCGKPWLPIRLRQD